MISDVFVDSGAWIALLDADDPGNGAAARYWDRQVRAGVRFMTTNYVVSEAGTWLRYHAGLPAALALRQRIDAAGASRLVRCLWVDEHVGEEAWRLLAQYADVKLSVVDATSAVVARKAGIGEVFGFDGDFRALGFDVQPAR